MPLPGRAETATSLWFLSSFPKPVNLSLWDSHEPSSLCSPRAETKWPVWLPRGS